MRLPLSIIAVMFAAIAFAQAPDKMSYQSVVRDANGELVANSKVSVQISILQGSGRNEAIFSEVHNATTNENGLLSLEIGGGSANLGTFAAIDWAKGPYFIKTETDPRGGADFSIVGVSELLSVPYALSARTAESVSNMDYNDLQNKPLNVSDFINDAGYMIDPTLIKNGERTPQPGVPSNVWSLFGNFNSDPDNDKMGTTDSVDLVFVTNNTERLRITAAGQLITPDGTGLDLGGNLRVRGDSVAIDKDLYVGRNVYLNMDDSFDPPGQTINNGDFTVENMSSTYLTGSLTVDKVTDLNSTLTVDSATLLNDILTVEGATELNSTLNVTDATSLDNTLGVEGATSLNSTLDVNGITTLLDTAQSSTKDNGSLVVEGGVGIEKNLNLGGAATIGGPLTINNAFTVTFEDTGYVATFENTHSGKGDGIKIRLGRQATKNNPLAQDADALLKIVTGDGTGYLNYANLKLFLDSDEGNDPTIPEVLIPNLTPEEAADQVQAVAASACQLGNNVTNFIINSVLNTVLIDGINSQLAPILPSLHIDEMDGFVADLGIPGLINDVFGLPIDLEIPPLPHVPPLPENPICEELGPGFNFGRFELSDSVYTSNPLNKDNHFITFMDKTDWQVGAIKAQSIDDWAIAYLDLVYMYQLYSKFAGLDRSKVFMEVLAETKVIAQAYLKIGVEYSSGNGDYAEWLQRVNNDETIGAGDIVGVIGGKITKDLTNAEQVMAVSYRPIVLGNVPAEGEAHLGNNVAFMGQIPVKLMGPVSSGDYIIGNGDIAGYGIAVSPEDMTVEDFKLAVGRSWDTDLAPGPKMANTIVGVHNGDFVKILKQHEQKFAEAERRMASIESKLEILSAALPAVYANNKK